MKSQQPDYAGVCQAAVQNLQGRSIAAKVAREIARTRPDRQIEMTEHMVISNDFTACFAAVLVMTSRPDELHETNCNWRWKIPKSDRVEMGNELRALLKDIRAVRSSYSDNVLCLVAAVGFLRRILSNDAVRGYMLEHHRELYSTLKELVVAVEQDARTPPEKPEGYVNFTGQPTAI